MKHKYTSLFVLSLLSISGAIALDAQKISTPVSVGELFDKMTILEIKVARFTNEQQRANVAFELKCLQETIEKKKIITPAIEKRLLELKQQLLQVNQKLWNIEDAIRAKEAQKSFDTEFIKICRSVYFTNDKRCRIKRAINELTGSAIIEEKQYSEY